MFDNAKQIGFARIITDYATFGYLEDVYIDLNYRGLGLGKWLMECVLFHPKIAGLKKLMLAKSDAQSLYEQYEFTPMEKPETVMERFNREAFSNFSWLEKPANSNKERLSANQQNCSPSSFPDASLKTNDNYRRCEIVSGSIT